MPSLDEIMASRNAAEDQAPAHDQMPRDEPDRSPPQHDGQAPDNLDPDTPNDDPDPITGLRKALDAERGKGRKYKDELASVRREFEGFRQQFTGFLQGFQQQNPQSQQPKAAPDLWDDPQVYVRNEVGQVVQPMQEALMYNAKLTADAIHTPEKVETAEQQFLEALRGQQLTEREYEAVINSPNRYHACVQWAANRPEAVRERMRAELMAEMGIDPGQVQQQRGAPPPQQFRQQQAPDPSSMPTSFAGARNSGPRAAPQWSGPKSLSEIMKR